MAIDTDVQATALKPVVTSESESQNENVSQPSNGDKKEDLISYSKYREILDEKKKTQKKLEEFLLEQEKTKQAQLEKQGEFEKLYNGLKADNESLSKFKIEIESDLQAELDKELENASDLHKQLINDSAMSLQKKISYLRQLKGDKKSVNDSLNSERAGGDAVLSNIDLSQYIGKSGRVKLMQLRKTDPKLWDKVIELKNKI